MHSINRLWMAGRSSFVVFLLALVGFSSAQGANTGLTFAQLPYFTTGDSAQMASALADLNGDNKPDLIRCVMTGGLYRLCVKLGNGAGGFGAAVFYPSGQVASYPQVADMNNDGKQDVVVANLNDSTVGVFLGNGNGTLQAQITYPIAMTARSLAIVDFNLDGRRDVILTGRPDAGGTFDGYIATLMGNGSGSFSNLNTFSASVRTTQTSTRSVAAGDFNGDGYPDFLVSNPANGGTIAVFTNLHNGTFSPLREIQVSGVPGALAVSDFNNDGKLDVAFTLTTDPVYGSSANNLCVAFGLGNGVFGTNNTTSGAVDVLGGATYYAGSPSGSLVQPVANLVALDMSGDGNKDLLYVADPSTGGSGLVSLPILLRGATNGIFSFGAQLTASYQSAFACAADFNGDGDPDILVTGQNNTVDPFVTAAYSSSNMVVTTTADEDDGNPNPANGAGTSLREAFNYIVSSNNITSNRLISFAANLAGQTIVLTNRGDTGHGNSAFFIPSLKSVELRGLPTGNSVTLNASGLMRHFYISEASDLTLSDLNLSGGNPSGAGGSVYLSSSVQTCKFVAARCTFNANTANYGGVLYAIGSKAVALLTNCTMSGNSVILWGGAIYTDSGGPTIDLTQCTLAKNTAGVSGAGIHMASAANVILRNTLCVSNGVANANLNTTLSSNNVFTGSDAGGLANGVKGNQIGVGDAKVSTVLTNNGGSSLTLALLPGSPAINAGAALTNVLTDQRGIARPQGGGYDVGAYEAVLPATPTFAVSNLVKYITDSSFSLVAATTPSPTGGVFIGTGVSGGNFSPATAGLGVFTVVYTTPTNSEGFSSSANVTVTVVETPSLIVTTTGDLNNASDGQTSLREAVAYAATLAGPQTITFSAALAGQTVVLTNGWTDALDASALRVTNSMTIQGRTNSPGVTIAVGSGLVRRHLRVGGTGNLTLDRLTFTGGHAPDRGGVVENADTGSLTVRNCTMTGNTADWEGGALHAWYNASLLTVENSTLVGNSASNQGAAIVSGATLTTLRHLTVVSNACPAGSFWIYQIGATLQNSIVAGNNPDGIATFGSGTLGGGGSYNNILGTGNAAGLTNGASGNLLGVSGNALLLGALANNGGPTFTMALLTNSPALNAGGAGVLTNDQRGVVRPQFGTPDIGAYEQNAFDTGQTVVNTGGAYWYLGAPAVGSDWNIYREILGQTPVNVGGWANRIGLANNGLVLVENAALGVYVRAGSLGGVGSGWLQVASASAGDGATWFLGPDGAPTGSLIYRWATNGAPVYADGAGTNLIVTSDGNIMTDANDGTVWFRLGSSTGIGSAWVRVTTAPIALSGFGPQTNGNVRFSFTNQSAMSFSVRATTNLATPLTNWVNLGAPTEGPAGVYQFTAPPSNNAPQYFFRIESP